MSHSVSVQKRFLALRAEGLSYDAIAEELHISKHTLVAWGRRFKPKLDELRALATESVLDEYALRHEHRVRLLAETLQTVRRHLKNKTLINVPPAKLLDTLLRITTMLDKLDIAPESLPAPKDDPDADDLDLETDLTPDPSPVPPPLDDTPTPVTPDQADTNGQSPSPDPIPPSTESAPKIQQSPPSPEPSSPISSTQNSSIDNLNHQIAHRQAVLLRYIDQTPDSPEKSAFLIRISKQKTG